MTRLQVQSRLIMSPPPSERVPVGSLGTPTSVTSSSSTPKSTRSRKELPPLFWYMELGDWDKATIRASSHPREVKSRATLRTKSNTDGVKTSGTKRLALHHACFKLRAASSTLPPDNTKDPFLQVCKFILLLIDLYPEAAGMRESRHGCLPLHLAAFASGIPRPANADDDDSTKTPPAPGLMPTTLRPIPLTTRSTSETTTESNHTNMTAVFSEELRTGKQTDKMNGLDQRLPDTPRSHASEKSLKSLNLDGKIQNNELGSLCVSASSSHGSLTQQSSSVRSSVNPILVASKREEMMVRVINALLDAYPKAIRVDSEGGRLALHTACAGRATPRVISTLVTAYPAAARHRNKDGFLPLHLAAHWGVSHPNVAVNLLKSYPDATVGRNRWERTPLEEALCMAGENGRKHQAPLVRALRKHPSYWTRPPQELFNAMRRETEGGGHRVVDMDETIPSTGSEEDEDNYRYFNSGYTHFMEEETFEELGLENSASRHGQRGLSVRHLLSKKGKEDCLDIVMDLPTLIKNSKWKAVVARLECNPDEAEQQLTLMTRGGFIAMSGMMPLHYACERKPPVEVVQALIEAFPEAVSTKMMPGGCLPLHIASTWHASNLVVDTLLQADPATVKVVDELGNRPLHAVCFSGATTAVVNTLLTAYPKAVLARNNQGSQPLDIVRRLRHENKKIILAALEETKKNMLSNQHKRNLSSGSWTGVADRAVELNDRDGPPLMEMDHMDNPERYMQDRNSGLPGLDGVEVSYQEGKDGSQLLWI